MTAIPVLFTHFGDEWIRGSEMVLLDLLRALDKSIVMPVVWCNGAEMAAACRKAGYPTLQADFRYYFDYDSPAFDMAGYRSSIRACRALCRQYGIRILHANSGAPTQWLIPAGFSERLPVLVHLHIDYLKRSRYAMLLHAATRAVGVCRQATEGLLFDGMAADRVQVIYNGIDFSRLPASPSSLRVELGIADDALVVTTAGSLIHRKGHDLLLRAFAELPPVPVKPHLVLAGHGPERAALEGLAHELGVGDRAHFLGNVDNVAQVYEAADIFALATRGDACPLVIAEACHFGLPILSTRVGGIPEMVVQEETGLLVPPDDIPAFAGALLRLAGDKALRERLGAGGVVRADDMFSAPKMARQFEQAYLELAAIAPAQLGWGSVTRRLRPYWQIASGRKSPPRYAA